MSDAGCGCECGLTCDRCIEREHVQPLRAQLAAMTAERDALRAEAGRLQVIAGNDPTTATRDDLRRWTTQQHDEIRDLRACCEEMEVALRAWQRMRATPALNEHNSSSDWAGAYQEAERLLDGLARAALGKKGDRK